MVLITSKQPVCPLNGMVSCFDLSKHRGHIETHKSQSFVPMIENTASSMPSEAEAHMCGESPEGSLLQRNASSCIMAASEKQTMQV